MINFFKRIFRKKKRTYVYALLYFDYVQNKKGTFQVLSERDIGKDYPKFYGGIINHVELLFIFEE